MTYVAGFSISRGDREPSSVSSSFMMQQYCIITFQFNQSDSRQRLCAVLHYLCIASVTIPACFATPYTAHLTIMHLLLYPTNSVNLNIPILQPVLITPTHMHTCCRYCRWCIRPTLPFSLNTRRCNSSLDIRPTSLPTRRFAW
jgi:hypothetical protein